MKIKRPPILFLTTVILHALNAWPTLSGQPSNVTIQYAEPQISRR
jgi:hypothetical protein